MTSLPELATGISAVMVADAPNIALGDVLGSTVFNLALLVVLDVLHRPETIYRRASTGHILSAGFAVILLSLVGAPGTRTGCAEARIGRRLHTLAGAAVRAGDAQCLLVREATDAHRVGCEP